MPAAALAVEGLTKTFGGVVALDRVTLSVARGTVHALCGGNGSGKSTLIKAAAGVQPADAGRFLVGEASVPAVHMTPERARDLGLRFVHQQTSTFAELTVADNLALGNGYVTGRGGRIRTRAQSDHAAAVLDCFRIEADPAQRLGALSPPKRMMVAIARALQHLGDEDAGVLVLDEPTAALGDDEADQLLAWLREHADRGRAVLYVSHRLREVVAVADRATVLRDGRVADELGRGGISHAALARTMLGADVADAPERPSGGPAREGAAPALRAAGLTGGRVRAADLAVRAGEVVGLAGLLGSGRSTLLRLLFGAERRVGGHVELDGRPLGAGDPAAAVRAGLAFVPEQRDLAVFAGRSVAENLSMPRLGAYWRRGVLSARAERADALRALAEHGIRAPSPDAPVERLSGGNQQKVVLARCVALRPRVLLLDEPTQGVDVGARAEIHALVRRLSAGGAGVVVASADSEELAQLSDRVLVLREGRLVAEVPRAELDPRALERLALGASA